MAGPIREARSGTESEPKQRINYWAHCIEGSLFIGGLSFVSPHTVLPRMFQALGAPGWLIALAPSLLVIGFILPGLFVARRIEMLPQLRPFVRRATLWQRAPYLFAGLGLLGIGSPLAALALVAATPLASGLCGGVAVNAWKEYVASTIPEHQRASLWALRFFIGTVIGLGAGKVVSVVLDRAPGAAGYGVLHVVAFGFLAASYAIFSLTHEGERAPRTVRVPETLRDSLRELPELLRANPAVRAYAFTRFALHGFLIMAPFLGIRALEVLGKPDAYLGELLVANTVGSLIGFLLGGYSGDRHGGKPSLVAAHAGFLALALLAPFAGSETTFLSLFVLFGVAFSLATVAAATLDLEIAPSERRPTYQALLGIFVLGGVLTSSLASALIRGFTPSFSALCLPAGAMVLCSMVVAIGMPEPRRRLALGR
jgi:MFS family permease